MMRPKITTPAVSVFVREMSPAILVVYADGVLLSLCWMNRRKSAKRKREIHVTVRQLTLKGLKP